MSDDLDRHAWERPGAHEVAPGIHRIPLPLPGDLLKAVNVYAISDGDQVVLIDGGWALAEAEELLARALGDIGYDLPAVREFLVTHAHRDHYTQAVAVRRRYGSRVALGAGEEAALTAIRGLRDFRPDISRLHAAGAVELSRVLAATRRPAMSEWELPDRWLTDGIDIALSTRTLRVIATPGHTSGHVVFYDPEHATLFAGDHILPHITPSIGVEPVPVASPLRSYLNSLDLIRALPDARLLPAHGPVADSVHDRVDELIKHHEERLSATADAIDHGAETAFQTALALTWTRHRRRLGELDEFNQIMAVNETMAHLRVLVERGWLQVTDADGVLHFART